ncbi:Ribonuclease P protein component [Bacillus cereus]|nr:Ribonuclease P protein component [Bacillus cereus]
MKKKHRIKKNDEFQAVFQKGKSNANRQFVVYQLDKEEQPNFASAFLLARK